MSNYAARLTTLRRLVAADSCAQELAREVRQRLGELWARRMAGELGSASSFVGLHQDCLVFGAHAEITRLTARAVDDERFHAELCLLMAEHHLGSAMPAPEAGADSLRFETCASEVAPALRFLLHSALNETVAVAYLQQCHREASSALVRAALRELLADEIDHSRVGWAYVASVVGQPPVRASLCRELPTLLRSVSDAWATPSVLPPVPPGHGFLEDDRTLAVVNDTVLNVILPGLARLDIAPE